MDHFRLLCLLSLVYVASVVVGIGCANKVDDGMSWMSYWNSALPNSPVPSKAVQQLLNLGGARTYAGIGKDAVSITPLGVNFYGRTSYAASAEEVQEVKQGERTHTGIGKVDAVSLTPQGVNFYGRTSYAATAEEVQVKQAERSHTGIGKDAVSLTPQGVNFYGRTSYAASAEDVQVKQGERSHTGTGKDAVSLTPLGVNFYGRTSYAASSEEVKVEPGLTLFFLGKDLQQSGKTVTLRFLKPTSNKAILLPRQLVKSIPFSSSKFPEILAYYGVKPKSEVAETMKRTIKVCEAPAVRGEEKYCATSLESLIDFTVSKIGKQVQVCATEAETENEKKQEYTIETAGVQSLGDRSIVCHKQNYVYGVFYCHKFYGTTTKAYMVPLVSADGVTKAKALAVCHTDTSGWNPKHLAFRVLRIKPGNTIPVCHFLATTSVLWAPM